MPNIAGEKLQKKSLSRFPYFFFFFVIILNAFGDMTWFNHYHRISFWCFALARLHWAAFANPKEAPGPILGPGSCLCPPMAPTCPPHSPPAHAGGVSMSPSASGWQRFMAPVVSSNTLSAILGVGEVVQQKPGDAASLPSPGCCSQAKVFPALWRFRCCKGCFSKIL